MNIYVPHHPQDEVSITSIVSLREVAAQLGVELLVGEVTTREEAVAAVEALPEDTAIFLVPIPSIDTFIVNMAEAADKRGIVIGTYHSDCFGKGAIIGYTPDLHSIGEQAARLADQILKGTRPADLPVQITENLLTVNLPTAQAAGIDIPDEILEQANTIIR